VRAEQAVLLGLLERGRRIPVARRDRHLPRAANDLLAQPLESGRLPLAQREIAG